MTHPYYQNYAHLPDFNERVVLLELLAFEVKERRLNHFNNVVVDLYPIWVQVIHDHMIDSEYRYIYPDEEHAASNQNLWEDERKEIVRATNNCLSWIEKAKEKFEDILKILYIRILNANEYSKHFPNPNWNMEKIRKTSLDRGILNKEVSVEVLDGLFREAIEQCWPAMVSSYFSEIIVETNSVIGFNGGEPCKHLLYKIDRNNYEAHAYPLHVNELHNWKKSTTVDFGKISKYYNSHSEIDVVQEIDNYVISRIY